MSILVKANMIAPQGKNYQPTICKMAELGSFSSKKDAIAHATKMANSSGSIAWSPVPNVNSLWPGPLDIEDHCKGDMLHLFFLDQHCRAYFDETAPFLEVHMAGAPANGWIEDSGTLNSNRRWAYVFLKTADLSGYERLPIIFNFVDIKTKRSPYFLGPYLSGEHTHDQSQESDHDHDNDHDNDHNHDELSPEFRDPLDDKEGITGLDKSNLTHDGIHPPTVSSSIIIW